MHESFWKKIQQTHAICFAKYFSPINNVNTLFSSCSFISKCEKHLEVYNMQAFENENEKLDCIFTWNDILLNGTGKLGMTTTKQTVPILLLQIFSWRLNYNYYCLLANLLNDKSLRKFTASSSTLQAILADKIPWCQNLVAVGGIRDLFFA